MRIPPSPEFMAVVLFPPLFLPTQVPLFLLQVAEAAPLSPVQEEWGLLDEAQKCLDHHVMLETLALLSSLEQSSGD
ncbi:uncharacterized protein LOC125132904 isoform X5 [Phacochoerus africanus]|uniref:uncharacterized protein LOC125132904 isoform X5 n=1 Tax=Phacochoerus africanus TaxID=41426 RepID=UPI001FDA3968|nr:uncharacterized protein LOC125132904 isoform X5 [Phacochoerus africanus]